MMPYKKKGLAGSEYRDSSADPLVRKLRDLERELNLVFMDGNIITQVSQITASAGVALTRSCIDGFIARARQQITAASVHPVSSALFARELQACLNGLSGAMMRNGGEERISSVWCATKARPLKRPAREMLEIPTPTGDAFESDPHVSLTPETPPTGKMQDRNPKETPPETTPWETCPPWMKRAVVAMPFAYQWEIVRFIQPSGPLFWSDLCQEVLNKCTSAPHASDLYTILDKVALSRSRKHHLQRGTFLAAAGQVRSSEIPTYGVKISVDEVGNARVRMQPPSVMLGHRAARKYGAERFVTVGFAEMVDTVRARALRAEHRHLSLLGRTYELIQEKDAFTARFFATRCHERHGMREDLETVSIDEFVQWHYPLTPANLDRRWAKFVARIDMAFSGTHLGLMIEDHQVIPDIAVTGPDGKENLFTDGCGLISYAAMCKLRPLMGWMDLPAAVQGRFGSAKGMWMLDPSSFNSSTEYVRSRASMSKYELPGPPDPLERRFHSTLEVIRPARAMAGFLNRQIIPILSCGGVPHTAFTRLLDKMLSRLRDKLNHVDPVMVVKELELQGSVFATRFEGGDRRKKDREEEGTVDDEDRSLYERCIKMLRAGFLPSENAYLQSKLNAIFQMLTHTMLSKFNIAVPKSRRLLMVPDPTGTLEPGQVFAQLPEERDEDTGERYGVLTGSGLVTRNPAYVGSDVQRVVFVDVPQLHRYDNVVIMSVKGDCSLASLLGGGDYDGDDCLVIWDQELVEPFHNVQVELPDVAGCFEEDKRSVRQVLSAFLEMETAGHGGPLVNGLATEAPQPVLRPDAIAEALFQRFCLPGTGEEVGYFSNRHMYVADGIGVNDPYSVYLAVLCAELLDARKAGKRIKPEAMSKNQSKVAKPPWSTLDDEDAEQYMDPADAPPPSESTSALTYLFQHMQHEHQRWKDLGWLKVCDIKNKRDPDLCVPWEAAKRKANALDTHFAETQMSDMILQYKRDICDIWAAKKKKQRRNRRSSVSDASTPATRVILLNKQYAEDILPGASDEIPKLFAASQERASLAYVVGHQDLMGQNDPRVFWPWDVPVFLDLLCQVKVFQLAHRTGGESEWWRGVRCSTAEFARASSIWKGYGKAGKKAT
ncbi:RNA dependent RNA polymerase-domain-containing protein [Powellomyces hirtus]|nr:RNA dependent RNA polymerase-domain-containing protein [Powellomyces hirtus]